jgi:hypothetical protein
MQTIVIEGWIFCRALDLCKAMPSARTEYDVKVLWILTDKISVAFRYQIFPEDIA